MITSPTAVKETTDLERIVEELRIRNESIMNLSWSLYDGVNRIQNNRIPDAKEEQPIQTPQDFVSSVYSVLYDIDRSINRLSTAKDILNKVI